MDSVIDVSRLEKRFGRAAALDGLALNVAKGEVHGFLGSNDSGKLTADESDDDDDDDDGRIGRHGSSWR